MEPARCRTGVETYSAKAHPYMKHGQWLPWLEKMGYDDAVAQKLIRCSEWIASNDSHASYLPVDTEKIYTLARLETPPDVQGFFEMYPPDPAHSFCSRNLCVTVGNRTGYHRPGHTYPVGGLRAPGLLRLRRGPPGAACLLAICTGLPGVELFIDEDDEVSPDLHGVKLSTLYSPPNGLPGTPFAPGCLCGNDLFHTLTFFSHWITFHGLSLLQ